MTVPYTESMCSFFTAIFQTRVSCFMVGLLSTHFIQSNPMKFAGPKGLQDAAGEVA